MRTRAYQTLILKDSQLLIESIYGIYFFPYCFLLANLSAFIYFDRRIRISHGYYAEINFISCILIKENL